MMQKRRPVMLVVLDGWGWREDAADNAVRQARTPSFDRLWATCSRAFLHTSGKDVGLPPGQMGNSEVGHLNIGAGRLVLQDLPRIGDGDRQRRDRARAGAARPDRARCGRPAAPAISWGWCRRAACIRTRITPLRSQHSRRGRACRRWCMPLPTGATRRRDRPARTLPACWRRCRHRFRSRRSAAGTTPWIATKRWERVAKAYHAIVDAEGPRFPDAGAVVADAYAHDISDEFVVPAVVGDYRGMRDGDGLLCFNFRADRVREILSAPARSGVRRLSAPRASSASPPRSA